MTVAAPSVQVIKWRPRGNVMFATRDTSVAPSRPASFAALDCVDQLSLSMNAEFISHVAKCSGFDSEDKRDLKGLSAELTISFSNYTPANVMAAIAGTMVAKENAPVAVTNEELATVAGGESVLLGGANPNFNITGLSLTDSASSAATLVADTDYVLDADYGMVTFKSNVSAYTQPFIADYSHANPALFAALKAATTERWLRFNGFNPVNENKLIPVDIYRVQFAPAKAMDFLPDDYGKLEVTAAVLIDLTRTSSDPRGQFYYQGMEA